MFGMIIFAFKKIIKRMNNSNIYVYVILLQLYPYTTLFVTTKSKLLYYQLVMFLYLHICLPSSHEYISLVASGAEFCNPVSLVAENWSVEFSSVTDITLVNINFTINKVTVILKNDTLFLIFQTQSSLINCLKSALGGEDVIRNSRLS